MAFPDSVVPRLLKGRLALITGAGQGNGAKDMKGSTVEETARLVRHEGAGEPELLGVTNDVRDPVMEEI